MEAFWEASKIFFSGGFVGTFWEPSGKILGTFWEPCRNLVGTFWKLSWSYLGAFWELLEPDFGTWVGFGRL